MPRIIRLPFTGEERTKILEERGYDLERIKRATPEELANVLKISEYLAYLIIKAANEANVENVPDELVPKERICPKCGNIITGLEYECGKCGYRIKNIDMEYYERYISKYVDTFIALSKNPRDGALWLRLKEIYEALGNVEEALDVSLKIDLLKDEGIQIPSEDIKNEEPSVEKAQKVAPVPVAIEPAAPVIKEELAEIPEKPDQKTKFKNGLVNGFGVRPAFTKKEVRKRRMIIVGLVFAIIAAAFAVVFVESPPYKIDGNLGEWANIPSYGTFSSKFTSFKIGGYGNYEYLEITGKLDLRGGVNILIDEDSSASTGYSYGKLGSEYRMFIFDSGKLRGVLYHFESKDTHNWTGWKKVGGVKVAGDSDGIELRVPRNIFSKYAVAELVNDGVSSVPISLFKPMIVGIMNLGGGVAINNTKIGTLYLNNTYIKSATVKGLLLSNIGSKSLPVSLWYEGREIGYGTTGTYISLKNNINIKRSAAITVLYAGGAANGTKIRPHLKSIIGATSLGYTIGDGFYVNETPSTPVIDGIYADWIKYRNSTVSGNSAPSEDIVSFAEYAGPRESYYYLQTRGEMATGILVPLHSSSPKDSDRDGVPDSEDPYPEDFNNDGIPDNESFVVVNGTRMPDVDGDGIPDYPYGKDMWLNTTIPRDPKIPQKYWGKKVSVYIGPAKGAKPTYPYDFLEIYISGNKGFSIGGINAQYLFRLYGIGGTITKYEFFEYKNNKFTKESIDFDKTRDLAKSWARLEMKLPLNISNRDVIYRIVSYGAFYKDMAHAPFANVMDIHEPAKPNNTTHTSQPQFPASFNPMQVNNPDKDPIAGKFVAQLVNKYQKDINIYKLTYWLSTLDLPKGAEKNHVFTSADFIDGHVSHFKEEDYAYNKMKEIIDKEGMRPIYRVELLNASIFREEWTNLTLKTKQWEILHWMHDLENMRNKDKDYSDPYKLNWYNPEDIRTLEWLGYKLEQNINDWHMAFNIAKGIKSIDDARIGPFFAVYPTKAARETNWSVKTRAGPTHTVTFQLVRWYSGTSDCHGDNDGYVKITIGSWQYVSGEREDDDSWNARIIFTNSNTTGTAAYIKLENWEDDSGLCGGDDDYGSASFTYYFSTKTWSGSASTPYVHTSGDDGSAYDWFVIEGGDDNEAKMGIYEPNGDNDPMYGGICLNDPWDSPTIVTYYSGQQYRGYGYYLSSYYAFYVPYGKTISVHLQPSSYNYDLYLYDPSGNQKAYSNNGGTSEDDISFTADSSGYWIIRIYDASGGHSDWFKFWFTSGPDDKDFADISPTTGNSDTGYLIQSYGGVTYYDSSDDWKFYVPSSWISGKGVLFFWMKPNPNANFNVQLYDPGGNLKATGASGGAGQVDYVIYKLQSTDSAGFWYGRVLPASSTDYGNYTIVFWAGYVVDFYAQTDNSGAHTPMHSDNGVKVTYSCLGTQYNVYPNDDYYWEVYVDRDSSYSYASESNLSNDANGHRWISQNPPSGTISTGGSIAGHYYEQFYLTINTAHDTGYSSGKYFGADKSYSAPGSGWYDAGCTVTIRVDSTVNENGKRYQFLSWTGSGTGSYSGADNPASFTISAVTTETANWNEVPEFSNLAYLFFALAILGFFAYQRRKRARLR